MIRKIEIIPNKTYATEANADKAVSKVFGESEPLCLNYFIARTAEGRFFPVFMGERAVQAGAHFHFNVVG